MRYILLVCCIHYHAVYVLEEPHCMLHTCCRPRMLNNIYHCFIQIEWNVCLDCTITIIHVSFIDGLMRSLYLSPSTLDHVMQGCATSPHSAVLGIGRPVCACASTALGGWRSSQVVCKQAPGLTCRDCTAMPPGTADCASTGGAAWAVPAMGAFTAQVYHSGVMPRQAGVEIMLWDAP